jgi:hypothetical protein
MGPSYAPWPPWGEGVGVLRVSVCLFDFRLISRNGTLFLRLGPLSRGVPSSESVQTNTIQGQKSSRDSDSGQMGRYILRPHVTTDSSPDLVVFLSFTRETNDEEAEPIRCFRWRRPYLRSGTGLV